MCQNNKKVHRSNCHNNFRINHHPNFFNYYQYPFSPSYGCGTPPLLIKYLIPQPPYPPLFAQYQYFPIIQYSMTCLQPNQIFPLGQTYQYSPHNVGQNFNNLANNVVIDDNFQYQSQSVREDYYLSPYNYRIPLRAERYYNNFCRPSLPLSVKEEYNWAVHISDILDDFIGRHRNRPKYNFDEYKNLKHKLYNSLRHLQEAEALNQKLVNTWAKKNDNSSNNNSVHLPTDSIDYKLLNSKSDQSNALNKKKVSPIIVSSEPEKSSSLNENNVEDNFNFLDFEDNLNDNSDPENDKSSFFFNDEFKVGDSHEKKYNNIAKNNNDVNRVDDDGINYSVGDTLF